MRKLMQPIERLLFGATAEERVAMQMALVERRVDRILERAFEALNEPDEDEEQYSEAESSNK